MQTTYELTMTRALGKLNAANAKDVQALAAIFERVRGYGHVKVANVAMVKRGERDIAARHAFVIHRTQRRASDIGALVAPKLREI